MRQRYRLFRRCSGIFFILKTAPPADRKVSAPRTRKRQSVYSTPRMRRISASATRAQSANRPRLVDGHRSHHRDADLAACAGRDREDQAGRDAAAVGDGPNQKPFDTIRNVTILETQAEQFTKVLHIGTVSTNVYLRPRRGLGGLRGLSADKQSPTIETKQRNQGPSSTSRLRFPGELFFAERFPEPSRRRRLHDYR